MAIERRVVSSGSVRAASDGGQKVISGYAAVFNSLSDPIGSRWGSFKEQIASTAFSRSIASSTFDARCLWNHDPSYVLGRTRSKTLIVEVDSVGLKYTCRLGDTSFARDLYASIERGDVTGSSFGFECVEDSWNDQTNVRTLLELNLMDCGPVAFPAYPATSVDVRSLGGRVERITLGVYDARSLRLLSTLSDTERLAKAKALARELGLPELTSYRSAGGLNQEQGCTLYPHPGGLDPVAARERQEFEDQVQYSRWLAARQAARC